jgi:hypothetical protein
MAAHQTDRPEGAAGGDLELGIERRLLLIGLATTYLMPFASPGIAQHAIVGGHDAFLNISKFLTGRSSLDLHQSARLYEALVADTPEIAPGIEQLLTLVDHRKIEAGRLQHLLDEEKSPLASVPRRIVTAWYTGIVGEGGRARCITFETSLMHEVVADRLRPPSYCFGPHGSWLAAPV